MELAPRWPVGRVRKALRGGSKHALVDFLQDRHCALFCEPIKTLSAESHKRLQSASVGRNACKQWQFGFAITALCCLLVETFQCYRAGLPSSNRGELERLAKKSPSVSKQHEVSKSEWPSDGGEVFRCFFLNHQKFFPGVDGGEFYQSIRNGLLHQSQTKFGWRLRVDTTVLWDDRQRILNRKLLVDGLLEYFKSYCAELRKAGRDEKIWQHARRKIWWLIKTSVANP